MSDPLKISITDYLSLVANNLSFYKFQLTHKTLIDKENVQIYVKVLACYGNKIYSAVNKDNTLFLLQFPKSYRLEIGKHYYFRVKVLAFTDEIFYDVLEKLGGPSDDNFYFVKTDIMGVYRDDKAPKF